MNLDFAVRLTEVLIAIAFIQQSLEHLFSNKDEARLFLPKIILSILLILNISNQWVCVLLFIHSLLILKRFQGPYNGGSDRMSLLIISSLCLIHFMPNPELEKYVLGYLALQTILSYFLPGFFKAINPDWWNGKALQDLFCYSGFPASENLRAWAERPKLLVLASWSILLFELLFPLILLNQIALILGLVLAGSFHLANTYVFGFNRFFWVWLAAYPSLFWLVNYLPPSSSTLIMPNAIL